MIVTNESILERFAGKHNQTKKPLEDWLKIVKKADWQHLNINSC